LWHGLQYIFGWLWRRSPCTSYSTCLRTVRVFQAFLSGTAFCTSMPAECDVDDVAMHDSYPLLTQEDGTTLRHAKTFLRTLCLPFWKLWPDSQTQPRPECFKISHVWGSEIRPCCG
jgi:hypothetical protein